MKDLYNPIEDDIRLWAADPKELEPVQDWDIILSTIAREDLFLELAADDSCPKADYFLSLLYLIVGDAVRTDYKRTAKEGIESLIEKAERSSQKNRIYLWIQRSRDLLKNPSSFEYDDWCAGRLASKP